MTLSGCHLRQNGQGKNYYTSRGDFKNLCSLSLTLTTTADKYCQKVTLNDRKSIHLPFILAEKYLKNLYLPYKLRPLPRFCSED